MRILASLVLLVGLSAGTLFAQSVKVNYFEGSCELQSGKDWKKVALGATLDDKAVVRLGAASLLVIERANATVSLSKAGTYTISDVLAATQKANSNNLASIIGKKIDTAANGTGKSTATAGGVRANPKTEEIPPFSDGRPSSNIAIARNNLINKDLAKARSAFDDAVKYADATEKDATLVQIGETCLEIGFPGIAVSYFTKYTVATSSKSYSDYALIKARVLYESLSFDDAKAYAEATLKTSVSPKAKQGLLIVQALSERSLGREAAASTLFDLAIKENPSTAEGQLASQLKKSA